jgi:hypothetical protein
MASSNLMGRRVTLPALTAHEVFLKFPSGNARSMSLRSLIGGAIVPADVAVGSDAVL